MRRKGVVLFLSIKHKGGRYRICAPINRIYAIKIAISNKTDLTLWRLDGVKADGNTCICTTCSRMQKATSGSIMRGNFIADDVCSHKPGCHTIGHTLHDLHHCDSTLTKACQYKGASLIKMSQIIIPAADAVLHCQRNASKSHLLSSPRLDRNLAIIRRIEIQPVGIERVYSMHLVPHTIPLVGIMGIGIVRRITAYHVVACLGRDNIEDISLALAIGHKPLRRVCIIRRRRYRAVSFHITAP